VETARPWRIAPGRYPFTRYMNTGSAGRFENLIWCIEITGSQARIYSWSNSGTESKPVMRKIRWKSDDRGKLIGKEVNLTRSNREPRRHVMSSG